MTSTKPSFRDICNALETVPMTYAKKTARPPSTDKLISPNEAAELLGVAAQTLAHWRTRAAGPRYVLLTKRCVRYRLSDIMAWLECRVQDSTTENRQP